MLLGIFSTMSIMFYSSNMRTNLVTPQMEKLLETFDDMVERGATPYMAKDIVIIL